MDKKLFDRFCDDYNIVGITKALFHEYLDKKYPEGIPAHVNLRAEWAEFYTEGTSKV